jgi:hypothetical protein
MITVLAAQRAAVQLPQALPLTFKKPTILCAQRSAATAGSATRFAVLDATSMIVPHRYRITPVRRAVRSESRPSAITPGIPGLDLESRPAHDSAAQNRRSARRAFVLRPAQRAIRTTSLRITHSTTSAGTPELAQRTFRMHDSPHPKRKRSGNRAATGAERVAVQPPRAHC